MGFYTVGHRENYRAAIAKHGEIFKMEGGYAFLSYDDADKFLVEQGKFDVWAIWEIDCTEQDLEQGKKKKGEWWHYVKRDVPIIREMPKSYAGWELK